MENILKKPFHYRVIKQIESLVATLRFKYHLYKERKSEGYNSFPYFDTNIGKEAFILANGPSLKKELKALIESGVEDKDFLAVNAFATTEYYLILKPKYYCIADPGAFDENNFEKRPEVTIENFKKIDESTDWNLTLYIPKYAVDFIKRYITNPLITIKGIATLTYEGFEDGRYIAYKKGEAVPSFVNISIMGLYLLINMGYTKINLFGVDHSFLAGLGIDDDNQLCITDNHFYGTSKYPINIVREGRKWKMADFVYDKYLTFKEHEIMRGYADYLGVEVINHTKDSWIDAYTRISQIKNKE